MNDFSSGAIFPLGEENDAYARYFTGKSYLRMLSTEGVGIASVTFEPGCRNNWHIHRAKAGGGQILLCTGGRGWYQEWGRPARELRAGRCGEHPRRGQALARRGEGQLVFAPRGGGPRGANGKRMAGAGGRRPVRWAGVTAGHRGEGRP